MPKKKPLISKASIFLQLYEIKLFILVAYMINYMGSMQMQNHERAFFDSADWALCKVSLSMDICNPVIF